jgi:hypothetical protein
MFEYYNNILGIQLGKLIADGLLSKRQYDYYTIERQQMYIIRRACKGTPALVAYDSLPERIKAEITRRYGDPYRIAHRAILEQYIQPDPKAANYYATYQLPDGRNLPQKKQLQYFAEAIILNALKTYITELRNRRKNLSAKKSDIWTIAAGAVAELDKTKYPHDLPTNPRRLYERYQKYLQYGYVANVHGGYCNANSRKTNELIERIVISIYCMDNQPFGEWIHNYYLQFLSGSLQIADAETGELFDRKDFEDKNGNPIIISKSTIWNILNNPENHIIIDRMRKARIDHITQSTPFNRRRKPEYSLSMISLDDWQHNIRTTDGEKLNAYTAFDVTSTAIIGWTLDTRTPDTAMVMDCLRNMYNNLRKFGQRWPIEAQVENHLIRDMHDIFQGLFGFVTYCTPGLSRDKHAEGYIKQLKYGIMKRYQPVGRWYAHHDAYAVKNASKDEDYKQPRAPKDELIATTIEYIHEYNNQLHPNQKKYPGKTRWQVLLENINPDCLPIDSYKILRYIGNATPTSIRNNDYVRVQYEDYAIENFEMLKHLKPGNYEVTAYWLPDADGTIGEVYLWQGENYLGKAIKYERYNTAKAERTELDEQIRTNQAKRQKKFFAYEGELKRTKVKKVALLREKQYNDDDLEPEIIGPIEPETELAEVEIVMKPLYADHDDTATRAINSI